MGITYHKYKCVCSILQFVRGKTYNITVYDMTMVNNNAEIIYFYGNFNKPLSEHIRIFRSNDDGKMLYMENNVIILIRYDIYRGRLINKILNG